MQHHARFDMSWRAAAAVLVLVGAAGAAEPDWNVQKPSNTGIPGNELRFMGMAPDGRLWTAGRWPVMQQGGVGIYDPATRVWTNHANWDSPIPSEFVDHVGFAPDGTAWISGRGGLVRKSGDELTLYDATNSPLQVDAILNTAAGSDGHVWVNNDTRLYEFDGATWTHHAELPLSRVSSVYVDGNDHVWVGTSAQLGLAEYDGASWTMHAGAGRFATITGTPNGVLWLLDEYDFYRFDGTTFTRFNADTTPLSGAPLRAIATPADGVVLVGTAQGDVIRTVDDGETWSLLLVHPGLERVTDLAVDPVTGDVWVGERGAIRRHDATGAWIDGLNTFNTGMPWWVVESMYLDREGRMWFSTIEAGSSRYDGQRYANLGSKNPNEPWLPLADGTSGVWQDAAGDFWLGTNGMLRWDGETMDHWQCWCFWTFSPACFAEDVHGTFWAVAGSLLNTFDGAQWTTEHSTSWPVAGMVTDSAGTMWVADEQQLHRWDGASWETVPSPLMEQTVFDMAIDANDHLWIGTALGGLFRYDGVGWTNWTVANSPLPARSVSGIDIRDDGVIGLASYEFTCCPPFPNGVVVIDGDIDDPASWSTYTYEDTPLPHYQLGKARFDAEGDLWISALTEGVAELLIGDHAVPGDVNGDGTVDLVDLLQLLAAWGPCGPHCPFDLTGDDVVDIEDLLIVLANWS
jgi:ligand-binding sensor domain-containing protein